MLTQRRKAERYRCDREVLCDTCVARVTDVSASGMRLEIPRQLQPGQKITVCCRLGTLRVACQVVWVRATDEGSEVGVRFLDARDTWAEWVAYVRSQAEPHPALPVILDKSPRPFGEGNGPFGSPWG